MLRCVAGAPKDRAPRRLFPVLFLLWVLPGFLPGADLNAQASPKAAIEFTNVTAPPASSSRTSKAMTASPSTGRNLVPESASLTLTAMAGRTFTL